MLVSRLESESFRSCKGQKVYRIEGLLTLVSGCVAGY